MYLRFYNLNRQPFHITPDPEFLYLSPSHKEALAAIIYGIEQRKGFVTITGGVGVGKTTILRSYLETADRSRLKIIYVFNPKLTFEGLLKTIYQELGLPVEGSDVVEMVNRLYQVLIEEYKQGNTVVLVVDEAQNMPIDTLENLRMISNLETSRDKLIQIILVGQPEFEEELNLDRLRQLKQRLAIRATILPLTKDESFEYIAFRLQKAGAPASSVFTRPALKDIARRAKGIPRVLNVLCDNALVTGYGYQKKPVTKKMVGEIAGEFERGGKTFPARWWPLATVGLVILMLGFAGYIWRESIPFHKVRDLFASRKAGPEVVLKEPKTEGQSQGKIGPVPDNKEGDRPEPARAENPNKDITRTVGQGDTLSKLAQEIYGAADSEVISAIREHNPQIVDPNVIHPGSVVVFPRLPHQDGTLLFLGKSRT
jgi:general secretion pathway protein A